MRFAFKTSPQNTTWADMLAVWQAADDIEVFESGWTFDHFYPIFSDSTGPCLEGWVTLTALAQATKRLRVGVLVTGIQYRHPAVLANMAATLDIISDGRLELGIGAGWNEEESDAYGIELGTLKERFDRFDEACEVITGLLQGDDDLRRQVLPAHRGAQRAEGPAAAAPADLHRRQRREAHAARSPRATPQHWNFVGGPPEEFARKRDVLAAHCADIGRDPKEIMLSAHVRLERGPQLRPRSIDEAAALGKRGLDLAIIYLPPPLRSRGARAAGRATIRASGLLDSKLE